MALKTGRTELSDLHLRIIAALQVDGRAPWSRIADALGEPERTVARYGVELLEEGVVTVAAIRSLANRVIVSCECTPGSARLTAQAMTQQEGTIYSYLTTGTSDVVTEVGYSGDLVDLLTLQVPATPGITRFSAFPVLRYFKTVRGWRVGALSPAEERALTPRAGSDDLGASTLAAQGQHDDEIIACLEEDGRANMESIARRTQVSATSASRRVDWLVGSGQISIRALVEPAAIGLPVEAMLWVESPPDHVEVLGAWLRERTEVRYLAAIAGDAQLLVDVTMSTHAQLYAFLAHEMWKGASRVRTDLVVEARKRGGRALAVNRDSR